MILLLGVTVYISAVLNHCGLDSRLLFVYDTFFLAFYVLLFHSVPPLGSRPHVNTMFSIVQSSPQNFLISAHR
jgi:hypothetical protein